ncbi:hypothetical protein [Sphingomonas nostoxanthinifaciens]|uniref:hypothetical protein n=1 Tax=Sphingomonas nostoxanthinifaciens TaxID=2872652 RepID=UPI001CC20461|nr:hypothetical protein [Sphingomonas nostoxanthinifaciens]UAK23790.1 hypothetical protein K8P63_15600 [Sphingomonas nostoxanthinifaciens]
MSGVGERGRRTNDGLWVSAVIAALDLHRGLFELSQGQLRAAQADFASANAKAPHYSDPLKAWSDLLARAGDRKGALAKYDEALKYAPAW